MIVELSEIKQKIKRGEDVVGSVFVNAKEAHGTVLANMSIHGKRQAEMSCTTTGCLKTHIREQSDWHQSYLCYDCMATKGGSSKTFISAAGELVRKQKILETDSLSVKDAKEKNNRLYNLLNAQKKAERAQQQVLLKQQRADADAANSQRLIEEREEEHRRLAQENLQRIKEYANKIGVPVSDRAFEQYGI